ncbi:MAG: short chain dehydrogenase, partial [Proteobacteria bacterium]|nr:short chain dehydrogenase [Pseudomonadota bacterium]
MRLRFPLAIVVCEASGVGPRRAPFYRWAMAEPVIPPIILVTGSSRGIGAAIVELLRARGATVLCHASRDYDDG